MKNRVLTCFTVSFLYLSLPSFSQYNVSKVNKKAIESYNKAMERVQSDDYKAAIPIFQDAIQKDPNYIDAYLSLAGVYGQIKNYQQSVDAYEKAFSLDSNYTSF
ncbi:MAG: tetratricopeptide repeat protein [Flavisolibacter sp.]